MGNGEQRSTNSAFAGLAGIVIGAVAGAAAVFFSDKKNRDKVSRKMTELKSSGQKALETAQDTAETVTDTAQEKAENLKAAIEDMADDEPSKAVKPHSPKTSS